MKSLSMKNSMSVFIWLVMLIGGTVLSIHFDKIYYYDLFNNLTFHLMTAIPRYLLLRLALQIRRITERFLLKTVAKTHCHPYKPTDWQPKGFYSCMYHPMHVRLLFKGKMS